MGVSGGPDSLCLLDLLSSLGYPVVAAHFNHHLRPESDDEAGRVGRFARERGLPFEVGEQDVAVLAAEEHLSVEEAARIARYRFLFDRAQAHQAQAVAVGHTADDQVETVLMHLLRGSGLAGLRGMSLRAVLPEWDPAIPLIRPLLTTWRPDTLAYCAERGLDPVFDPSNTDQTYFRNRLRHDLIPSLQTYNPRIKQGLFRMSLSLAGDYEVLEAEIRRASTQTLVAEGDGFLEFDFQKLKTYPAGMQRGLFREAIAKLHPALRDIDFEDVERALAFLERTPVSRQMDLTSGLRLLLEGNRMYLARWDAALPAGDVPQISPGCVYRLPVPGSAAFPDGWILQAEPVNLNADRPPFASLSADPYHAWLDASKLEFPLEIRGRRPGDRFFPLGMDGHSMKLSDFFVNEKLSRRLRDGWPLVCSGGTIAWIPGFRPAQFCAVDGSTREAVHLHLRLVAEGGPGTDPSGLS